MIQPLRIVRRARAAFYRLRNRGRQELQASDDYRLVKAGETPTADGWKVQSAVAWQHQAFQQHLQDAREGNPRIDFVAAARAIEATGIADPLVIEVGCGSGYYSEALSLTLGRPIRYVGIDFSTSMVALAHATYEVVPFLAGDACRLPLRDESCDILFSGTSLMHIANYRQALAESVRVSREWCIFHTVPLIAKRATTLLHKLAYGQRVVEVIFNQAELEAMLGEHKLAIRAVFDSIPYDVDEILGEPSWTLTYLCQKT